MGSTHEEELLQPLRIVGGFGGAVRAALGGWWRAIFTLTLLNLLWLLSLFTIVLFPPATAAMFYVARRVLEGDIFVGFGTFTQALRRSWRVAWVWALAFGGPAAIAATNLWAYQDAPGTAWTMLRWVWATLLVIWTTINLLFWPLWFAQDDAHRTLRVTWRNGLALLARRPLPALLLFVAVVLLATVSALLGAPLGLFFMAWTALLATATVAALLPRVEE